MHEKQYRTGAISLSNLFGIERHTLRKVILTQSRKPRTQKQKMHFSSSLSFSFTKLEIYTGPYLTAHYCIISMQKCKIAI